MADNIVLTVSGMHCSDCALTLEKGVRTMDGVIDCNVNFVDASIHVYGDAEEDDIVAQVKGLGYGVTYDDKHRVVSTGLDLWRDLIIQPRNMLSLIGIAVISMAFAADWLLPDEDIAILMFTIGGLMGLYYPARLGLLALRSGHGMDVNLLMTLAAVGAFVIGEYAEAAAVILLFSLGEALEGFTMERAREGIRSLTLLISDEATVLRPLTDCVDHAGTPLPDGSGLYQEGACPWCTEIPQVEHVESLAVGDLVVVKPGERIPMDGVVQEGRSAVNEAPITGESLPVEKDSGTNVYAGTVNGYGALVIQITSLVSDNTLARLIHLVQEAQAQKAPSQRYVERFARIYTPAVVVAAIMISAIPPLLFGQPFLDTASGPGWLYRALAMLVIACPCALVISTPVTAVSAISAASRSGVLIKGGKYLESLGKLRVMAFDKTGTLTHGRPELASISCANESCEEMRVANPLAQCADCDDVLALSSAVERRSSHPFANAVVMAADQRGLSMMTARNVENLPAQGVQGWVDGKHIIVGSHDLFHENGLGESRCCEHAELVEALGQTSMLVSENGVLRGYLSVSDPPRSNSRSALEGLERVGILHTVMLTGDNANVARSVGDALGIGEVRSNLLPQEKVDAVRALVTEYDHVAMVGDGVNDAPALAAASIGIAMGGAGTAQALETADVALMMDDLTQLPVAIRLGRRAVDIIRFNIWFAVLTKALFLIAALFGAATLWMAVFADMGAALFVTLNGMRLLRYKDSVS